MQAEHMIEFVAKAINFLALRAGIDVKAKVRPTGVVVRINGEAKWHLTLEEIV